MNSIVLKRKNIGHTKPISDQNRLPYKMVVNAGVIKQGAHGEAHKQEAK